MQPEIAQLGVQRFARAEEWPDCRKFACLVSQDLCRQVISRQEAVGWNLFALLWLPRCRVCSNVIVKHANASFPDGSLKPVAHRIFIDDLERRPSIQHGYRNSTCSGKNVQTHDTQQNY